MGVFIAILLIVAAQAYFCYMLQREFPACPSRLVVFISCLALPAISFFWSFVFTIFDGLFLSEINQIGSNLLLFLAELLMNILVVSVFALMINLLLNNMIVDLFKRKAAKYQLKEGFALGESTL